MRACRNMAVKPHTLLVGVLPLAAGHDLASSVGLLAFWRCNTVEQEFALRRSPPVGIGT